MPRSSFTPELNPGVVEKTIEALSPFTATHLNEIAAKVIGRNRVLSGLSIVQRSSGVIGLMPGAFIAGGVIVTLKEPIEVSYLSLLDDDGNLPADGGRNLSLILFAYCEDSAATSEIAFGVVSELDIDDVTGDQFVHVATRMPSSESGTASRGRWARSYGFANEDLARDMREGVQSVSSVPFAADSGLRLTSPRLPSTPYFVRDDQLLVFADRFLLPSEAMYADGAYYTRDDVRGIVEGSFDAAAFDFGGQYDSAYDLLASRWGFVVSRDVAWRRTYLFPEAGDPAITIPDAKAYLPGSGRLLVFRDGLLLAAAEYEETDEVTVTPVSPLEGALYDFVCFNEVVFREEHEISSADLDAAIGGPQKLDMELSDHLADANRSTLLVFPRVTSPSNAAADGGYVQINRKGLATRSGQAFKVAGGFQILDAGSIRLRSVEIAEDVAVTVVVVCLRGSTSENVAAADDQAQLLPFHSRWDVVVGEPGPDEVRACPDLLGFICELPDDGSVKVAMQGVDDAFAAADGSVIAAGSLEEYTLEQGPAFILEVSASTAPRKVTSSAAPEFGVPDGFTREYATAVLEVEGGAPSAVVASPVVLRAARLVEGVTAYPIGLNKLRVALDGILLCEGREFTEVSSTSFTVNVPMTKDQILEAWVE